MQIEIKIDEKCKEPKIIVMTDKMTDEVNAIIKRLSDEQPQVIAGFRDDVVEVLEPSEIYRVFAASGKALWLKSKQTRRNTGLPPEKEKTVQPRLWGYTVSLQKHPYGALANNASLFLLQKGRCKCPNMKRKPTKSVLRR